MAYAKALTEQLASTNLNQEDRHWQSSTLLRRVNAIIEYLDQTSDHSQPNPQTSEVICSLISHWQKICEAAKVRKGDRESIAQFRSYLELLESVAQSNATPSDAVLRSVREQRVQLAALIEAASNLSSLADPPPPPPVHIPDPLAQPRREISSEELRASAGRCFQKGLWEAASGLLEQLLARGEPLTEVAPKLITCLVSAHEDLIPAHAARIEDLLRQLEAAGHATLATELRQQHAGKLAPPKKPWWKVW